MQQMIGTVSEPVRGEKFAARQQLIREPDRDPCKLVSREVITDFAQHDQIEARGWCIEDLQGPLPEFHLRQNPATLARRAARRRRYVRGQQPRAARGKQRRDLANRAAGLKRVFIVIALQRPQQRGVATLLVGRRREPPRRGVRTRERLKHRARRLADQSPHSRNVSYGRAKYIRTWAGTTASDSVPSNCEAKQLIARALARRARALSAKRTMLEPLNACGRQ